MAMEDIRDQEYFIKSCNVWFPDFEEAIESKEQRYQKQSVHGMLALMHYFRAEITRQQFLSRFLVQEAPKLSADKIRYSQIRELCTAYQCKKLSDIEFDEKILLSFRGRPSGDVFSPAVESWDQIKSLISKLERKRTLPPWLECFGWLGYLKGNVQRKPYAEIVCGEGDYLCQLQEYGVEAVKEDLKNKYSMEVSAALDLRALCMNYRDGSISPDEFDCRFIQLAREFCSDVPE